MSAEVLSIPEERLDEVIKVIVYGLAHVDDISEETREALNQWCADEREYLERLNAD
jgi:hypothetical protein